jgi:hypothetical protein
MDERYYDAYLLALSRGLKKDAAEAVSAFVASFGSDEERKAWTLVFLKTHPFGERIRHEIYEAIVLPVLLEGSGRDDAFSLYWLAGTKQNLRSFEDLYRRLGYPDEIDLLREAFRIAPEREEVRRALLAANIAYISNYVWHDLEWMSRCGAVRPADCNDMLATISFARMLDANDAFKKILDKMEREVCAALDTTKES